MPYSVGGRYDFYPCMHREDFRKPLTYRVCCFYPYARREGDGLLIPISGAYSYPHIWGDNTVIVDEASMVDFYPRACGEGPHFRKVVTNWGILLFLREVGKTLDHSTLSVSLSIPYPHIDGEDLNVGPKTVYM